MNPFASVTFAWLTVCVFLLAMFAFMGLFRRVPGDAPRFGALLLLASLYDLASVLRYGHRPISSIPWEHLRVASGLAIMPVALDLAMRFAHVAERPRQWLKLAYAWFAVICLLNLFGVVVVNDAHVQRAVLGPFTIDYREAVISHAGHAMMFPAVLIALVATVFYYVRAARAHGGWGWAVAVTFLLVACAVVHDATTSITHLPSPFLAEHFMFIHLGALSFAFTARLSEESARRDDELARVRGALQEREALAAIGELAAIVAHEVRNPITVINNSVASLRKAELPRRERDLLLSILEEESERISRIVTDLLTLARPLHPQPFETLPKELILRCLGPAERAGTEVDLRTSPDAETPIQCDAHLLRHALENVIENAVQAMGTGGSLTITLTRKTRHAIEGREIAVIDTGEGMNTEVRNSARKAFFTTRTTGTGLGLAIVDRILTAHKGAVDIESSRGEGTTVRLFVPEPPTPPKPPA